ncbi:hypothetical protein QBC33DRAFT_328843 [Phialemonium atrogriseum]|uniref:Uncharacterized protein n=1 Tax=Phialemonium atrogriseum TaxID=1093897 RepID=A0AAJ0FII1_9PEZI|nr:uncharacterized protein QBC33DRAFT_328843 [Phialemonium atrogriseum]KAK1769631.1 hypothetical protein QBC33DRAFT_328843 [Phialemonium atrogriseum]
MVLFVMFHYRTAGRQGLAYGVLIIGTVIQLPKYSGRTRQACSHLVLGSDNGSNFQAFVMPLLAVFLAVFLGPIFIMLAGGCVSLESIYCALQRPRERFHEHTWISKTGERVGKGASTSNEISRFQTSDRQGIGARMWDLDVRGDMSKHESTRSLLSTPQPRDKRSTS